MSAVKPPLEACMFLYSHVRVALLQSSNPWGLQEQNDSCEWTRWNMHRKYGKVICSHRSLDDSLWIWNSQDHLCFCHCPSTNHHRTRRGMTGHGTEWPHVGSNPNIFYSWRMCLFNESGSFRVSETCMQIHRHCHNERTRHTHYRTPARLGSGKFQILWDFGMETEKATKPGPSTQSRTCAHTTLLNVDLLHLIFCITRCYQFGRASQLYIIHCTLLSPQPNCLAWNVSPFSPLGWLRLGQDLILVPSTSPPSLMPWSRSCRFVEKNGASQYMASKGSAMVICCNMLKYECCTSMAPYVYLWCLHVWARTCIQSTCLRMFIFEVAKPKQDCRDNTSIHHIIISKIS